MFVATSRGLVRAEDIRRIDVESFWSNSREKTMWKVVLSAPRVLAMGAAYGAPHDSERKAQDAANDLAARLSGQKVIS